MGGAGGEGARAERPVAAVRRELVAHAWPRASPPSPLHTLSNPPPSRPSAATTTTGGLHEGGAQAGRGQEARGPRRLLLRLRRRQVALEAAAAAGRAVGGEGSGHTSPASPPHPSPLLLPRCARAHPCVPCKILQPITGQRDQKGCQRSVSAGLRRRLQRARMLCHRLQRSFHLQPPPWRRRLAYGSSCLGGKGRRGVGSQQPGEAKKVQLHCRASDLWLHMQPHRRAPAARSRAPCPHRRPASGQVVERVSERDEACVRARPAHALAGSAAHRSSFVRTSGAHCRSSCVLSTATCKPSSLLLATCIWRGPCRERAIAS